MSKIKNKDEFKERDEIEEYFSEVKNKSFPTGIIFIFLLLLIIGGLSYYYFVIDSPKNIFLTLINNKTKDLENYKTQPEKINYEINLNTNIETTNKEYIDIVNIIDDIAISVNGGTNLNKTYAKINTFYKKDNLLSFETYYQSDKNIYLKSDELFDKVIKISENNQNDNENNKDEDNYKIVYSELIDIIKTLLNKAEYKKEYIKLDDKLVKKITLNIDKKIKEDFYNSLLENDKFLNSFSELEELTKEELKENINEEIENLNNNIETVSLYLSILENKFITLDINYDKDRIVLNKKDNQYIYKIYNKEIIEYEGSFELVKTNNDYKITLLYKDIEEDLNITLNIELSLDYQKDVETMDVSKSINIEDLSEEDTNKITTNLYNNNNLLNLIQDLMELENSNTEETTM